MDHVAQDRLERVTWWQERGAPDDRSAEAAARLHDVLGKLSEDAYFAGWLDGLTDQLEPHVRAALSGAPEPPDALHDGLGRHPEAVPAEFAEIVAIVREHRIWLAETSDFTDFIRVVDWPA